MTTRSVWDDLTDQAKEAIREVDKQLDAADALATAAKRVYESSRTIPWDPAEELIVDPKSMAQLRKAEREYREVSGAS